MNKMEDLINMTKLNELLNKKEEEDLQGSMDFCNYRYCSGCSCSDIRHLPFLYAGLS